MLTDEQIKALLAGCEGVTPGPWREDPPQELDNTVRNSKGRTLAATIDDFTDAAHIARCDPQTISELCTRVLDAEARVRELKEALLPFGQEISNAVFASDIENSVFTGLHEHNGCLKISDFRRARKALEAGR